MIKKSILCLLILGSTVTSFAQKAMTPENLFDMKRISGPVLSPDAGHVVYSQRSFDVATNKGNTDLYMYSFKTKSSKILVGESGVNESSPQWSNDGSKIYFLSDKGGKSCLWSVNADGSGIKMESEQAVDINSYGINPTGDRIWMSMDVKLQKVSGKEIYEDLPLATGLVYDDLMMRHWNKWKDGKFSHLFIADFSNGMVSNALDIMPGEPYDAPGKPFGGADEMSWSPDGKTLAYSCKRSAGLHYATHTNSDIYLYDVVSKQTNNISSGMLGYDKVPNFSPDGKFVIWQSQKGDGNEADKTRLFIYNIADKTSKDLTEKFDLFVEANAWSSDSRKIYFLCVTQATQQVFEYDLFSGNREPIRQLTKDIADFTEMTIASNASRKDVMVCSRMSMTQPVELFTVDLKSGLSTQITFANKEVLSSLQTVEIRKRMVKASDGKDILTWVIYPPGFDASKKYPTILYCQGGPQSPLSQFFSYRWNFYLMASQGYIVVAPNRRGMPGFGSEWNDQISKDWGGQPMRDLLSAIDDVSKEPYVDKNRLGAVGASFGGYSVFWLEGHHEKRFKAFISHCGVFNMESMLATEELFFLEHESGGYYWDTPIPKTYTEFSPHRYVDKWDTPILIISNELDYRVPYTQGLEAYSAARLKNIPARFINFPDEGHWVLKPQNAIQWQREFFQWLDKYLK